MTNLEHIEDHASHPVAWLCGWGAGGQAMDEIASLIMNVAETIELADDVIWLAFGLTAAKAPKHVLARGLHRIPDDAPVYRFDPFIWHLGAEVPMPWGSP